MRQQVITYTMAAVDDDGIAEAQTLAGAGPVDLDGVFVDDGVAVIPDDPQFVIIGSTGDDSGVTFTITGTDGNGAAIEEDLAGSNGDIAQSVLAYASVTSIVSDDATDGDIVVGIRQSGYSTSFVLLDLSIAPQDVGIQMTISLEESANYSYQFTLDDMNRTAEQMVDVFWSDGLSFALPTSTPLVNSDGDRMFASAIRIYAPNTTVNASPQTVTMTVVQAG